MAIIINQGVRNRIEGRIRQALESASLFRGTSSLRPDIQILSLDNEQDGVLKGLNRADRETIATCLGSHPIWALISAKAGEAIDVGAVASSSSIQVPLREVLRPEERERLASAVVDELTKLPRSYVYSFCLPRKFTEMYRDAGFDPIRHSRVKLEGSWQQTPDSPPIIFAPQSPVPVPAVTPQLGRLGGLFAPSPALAKEERVYLHLSVDGFVSRGEINETDAVAKQMLRSFLGLARALKILDQQWLSAPGVVESAAHEIVNGSFVHAGTTFLGGREAKLVEKLALPDDLHAQRGVADELNKLALLFSSPDVGRHIKLAGKWLFDYFTEDDGAMRVMQVAIATEVLLGSGGGEEGITKSLSTKLAYLIADTLTERRALDSEFRELYQLRSKVVHAGHERLSRGEYVKLRRFVELAGRAADREIRLALRELT